MSAAVKAMDHAGLLRACIAVMLAVLAGCATVPDTITAVGAPREPQAPAAAYQAPPANGAIFQAQAYRPLFEDRRARLPGDTLTIAINEKTAAAKQGADSASKTGSTSFILGKLFGLSASSTADLSVSSSTANKFEDKGASSSSNNFTGAIGVTVVDVLPNGNLVVAGEKQIALDRGAEFIRFSGVVNPDNIAAGNVVSSTSVADARVEYRSNTRLDKADVMSQLTRYFLSILPL